MGKSEEKEGFYTLKGYEKGRAGGLTASMEDYLEMICRLLRSQEVVRISQLADHLHVKPSSASRMAVQLKDSGLVTFEKYGYIRLTEQGRLAGEYLLYRHEVLHRFLCYVNHSEDQLEQVEKIEHFMEPDTIRHLQELLEQLKEN